MSNQQKPSLIKLCVALGKAGHFPYLLPHEIEFLSLNHDSNEKNFLDDIEKFRVPQKIQVYLDSLGDEQRKHFAGEILQKVEEEMLSDGCVIQ